MTIDDIAPRRRLNPETGWLEGEHAIITGINGYGKSYLARKLLSRREFVVVHNAKRSTIFRRVDGYFEAQTLRECIDAANAGKTHIVYSPSRHELRDWNIQNAFFEWVYQRKRTTVLIDELVLVTNGQLAPPSLIDCWVSGRELGIEIYGCTQQPVNVPNYAFTQARNMYAFYIALEPHRKKVCSYMPGMRPEMIEALPKHRFYYYREGARAVTGPWWLPPPKKRMAAA